MHEVNDDPELAEKFAKALLKGTVEHTYYKGATYDLDITLDDGKNSGFGVLDEDAETSTSTPETA